MEKTYLRRIAEYFYETELGSMDPVLVQKAGNAFLDYLGIAVYGADRKLCEPIVSWFMSLSGHGISAPYGSNANIHGAGAGAANAARTSSLELDDMSGVNASVHPGVYVWSAAVEAYKAHPCSPEAFIKAAAFGYDICIRFGMVAGENVRNFGLHGPGMIGGLAAAATASMIGGLDIDRAVQAMSITGSLLPICPFVSFIEGVDSKDMYGGWGVFLGLAAVEAAKRGLTGPSEVFEGTKGLKLLFSSPRGLDMPIGETLFITKADFKEFSGCFAVHPAMTAVMTLLEEEPVDPDQVEAVSVATYPYSYALSTGACAGPLNKASARLNLPYTVSYALYNRCLLPDAFTEESLKDKRYLEMMKKVTVSNHEEYGESELGVRGCIVEIRFKDGTARSIEVKNARWSNGTTTEQVEGKFRMLTKGALTEQQQDKIIRCTKALDCPGSVDGILECLAALG